MKILMVLTSHDVLGNTGLKTGFWLEEFAAPYFVFRNAGVLLTLAPTERWATTPRSEERFTRKPNTGSDPIQKDPTAQKALSETVKFADVKSEDYDTVFYVGGHGPMWDLAERPVSIALLESFYNSGKPIALVCHSPGVLRHVTYQGSPLVKGKRVTGFTNGEEEEMHLTYVVPLIFYREAGPKDAPTILLLHGLPSSSRMFEPLFTRLSERYHLVAPDYPGFGHSDWPDPKQFAYTFDHYAEIMNRFTETIGLSRYTLYMQDYGGPVGLRMILAHPERVEALIVQDAVAHNEGRGANWKTRREFWADRAPNESALRTNLLSLASTRTRHVENDPNVERCDPDLWTDELYFLNQTGQAEIQSDLFFDYRTNVDAYPKWQAWMREKQPRLLVISGKYELSFDPGEPERYRKDVPNAEVHVVDGGHFALDTAADQIAALVQGFVGASREGFVTRRAG